MPHFIEFHMRDLSRYVRLRQAFTKSPNPAIHQRVVGVEDFPHHPKRAFGHGVKQDAKRLSGGNFFVGACIALSEITPALFALVALLAGHNAVFNRLLRLGWDTFNIYLYISKHSQFFFWPATIQIFVQH